MKPNRFRQLYLTYFTYTRSERNAALVLTALLLLMQVYLWFRYYYFPQPGPCFLTANEEKGFRNLEEKTLRKSKLLSCQPVQPAEQNLDYFDPNTTDSGGFVSLGLSPGQASSLIRYRSMIGGFRDKEAVRKVRVLKPELFVRWEPYMRIRKKESAGPANSLNYSKSKKQKLPVLDLNRADTLMLQELPLIGAGRARAIFNYRERLGGYISVEQLREVKAIPDSVYLVIKAYLQVVSGPFRKLDINHLPLDSLRHPYLSFSLARMLVSYRNQHGIFKTYQDLEMLPLVNEEILSKLAPYLIFNP